MNTLSGKRFENYQPDPDSKKANTSGRSDCAPDGKAIRTDGVQE
jgi:hypothetical protein